MSETAFQKQFRQEMIAGFEQHQSLVRDTVTTETVVKGNEAEFLVADSGGAEAVTRGVNGMIPSRGDNNTQTTVTLVEWHDLVRKPRFNIFASQGDQRSLMQKTTMSVINRKIDSDIITELNTGTINTGSAANATLEMCVKSKAILQNADVPSDGQICALITPAFEAYLLQVDAFTSADYTGLRPIDSASTSWADRLTSFRWLGVNWIVHPNLPGKGTNAEKCFMYHRTAIGHAADAGGMNTAVGYEEEQDYSYARCSVFMGTQVLQNSGLVIMNHDGSAYAPA